MYSDEGLVGQIPRHMAPSNLLALPLEIRLQIYSLVLSIDCSDKRISALHLSRSTRTRTSQNALGIDMLLVCRQVHQEARLLPFQSTRFAFQRWYGSSTAECLKFLQRLEPQQTSALRHLALHITEVDMGSLSQIDKICSYLLPDFANGITKPGLKVLDLHVSKAGIWPDPTDFEDLFNLEKKWSIQGILRLESLRQLNITIAAAVKLPKEKLIEFEQQLRDRMAWCSGIQIAVEREMSPRQKFDEFARTMDWGSTGPETL